MKNKNPDIYKYTNSNLVDWPANIENDRPVGSRPVRSWSVVAMIRRWIFISIALGMSQSYNVNAEIQELVKTYEH